MAVLTGGGTGVAALATATLLGSRNALYSLRLTDTLGASRWRPIAAHLTIDESSARASAATDKTAARTAFWTTGVAVFVCWNVETIVGRLSIFSVSRPASASTRRHQQRSSPCCCLNLGLDGLGRSAVSLVPSGTPVLLAAGVAGVAGCALHRETPEEAPS